MLKMEQCCAYHMTTCTANNNNKPYNNKHIGANYGMSDMSKGSLSKTSQFTRHARKFINRLSEAVYGEILLCLKTYSERCISLRDTRE